MAKVWLVMFLSCSLAKSASLSVAVLVDFLVASPRLIRHLT